MDPQGSFIQPAGAVKWLYGLQRVKRELLPMPVMSCAVRVMQLCLRAFSSGFAKTSEDTAKPARQCRRRAMLDIVSSLKE